MLLLSAAVARGQTEPAQPVIDLRNGSAELARSGWPPPQAQIIALIERSFDLPGIALAVLGKHAAEASPAQQARLTHALALRLGRESLRYRPDPASDGFAIVERRPIGAGEWLVMTRAAPPPAAGDPGPRGPIVLGWRIKNGGAGWRIIDVLRDGISAVITERDDLGTALTRRDLDSVIADIERRAAAPAAAR